MLVDATSVVVMSEASKRKSAVWTRAGKGVVGRWVARKVESQVGVGKRDLVAWRWVEIAEVGLNMLGVSWARSWWRGGLGWYHIVARSRIR